MPRDNLARERHFGTMGYNHVLLSPKVVRRLEDNLQLQHRSKRLLHDNPPEGKYLANGDNENQERTDRTDRRVSKVFWAMEKLLSTI
jgi:hypothetical protein